MSMIGHFYLVGQDEIRALLEQPSLVHGVVDDAFEDQTGRFVDVDKAWHALHFLLTATAWEGPPPLDFIVTGGVQVGDEDVGYGPARVFTAPQVSAIAAALAPIEATDLARRFDAKRMETLEIYPGGSPGGWSDIDPNSDQSFGYFSGAFEQVKALVAKGAAEQHGMLVWLS